MIRQQLRVALLAGSLVAAAALTARADDAPQPAPAAPAADPCTPQYRTVCVNEWVPETYQTTRTVYERVCREEKYTAYRCESVPETRTRAVTTYRQVPEVKEVVHQVCVCVPAVEQRTVMKTQWTCVPETRVVRKCVDKGHYECQEVPCGPSFWERLHKLCHRSCCDECCEPCPVRTKTVKVWVPCPVWEEHCVTCMKRVCQQIPVTCNVTVYHREMREQRCQVTCYRCVPETHNETYTCMVSRTVPYEATRTVAHCVPREEKVTCTRMVCRTVQKQVPVTTCAAETSCCAATTCCAETTCCKSHRFHFCGGLGFLHHGCCD
jgi:hypothetical protein